MTLDELFESLNTRLALTWQKNGRFELTNFYVDTNYEIVIQIEKKPIYDVPVLKGKRTAEVSFYTKDKDGKESHEALNTFSPKQVMQILGIVQNSLLDKFEEYDAFYFTADKQFEDFEQKCRIYEQIVSRLSKRYRFHQKHQEQSNEIKYLASKIPFSLNEGSWFSDTLYLLSISKPVIFEEVYNKRNN